MISESPAWIYPSSGYKWRLKRSHASCLPPELVVGGHPPRGHHTGLKVANITRSMDFYSLLGWKESVRFRAGPARAVWLGPVGNDLDGTCDTSGAPLHVLELIEVPSSYQSTMKAVDLSSAEAVAITGLNHFTLDVSHLCAGVGLGAFLAQLNSRSEAIFDRSVRLVIEPYQQLIGQDVFEVAFVADPDGVLLEVLALNATLEHQLDLAW